MKLTTREKNILELAESKTSSISWFNLNCVFETLNRKFLTESEIEYLESYFEEIKSNVDVFEKIAVIPEVMNNPKYDIYLDYAERLLDYDDLANYRERFYKFFPNELEKIMSIKNRETLRFGLWKVKNKSDLKLEECFITESGYNYLLRGNF